MGLVDCYFVGFVKSPGKSLPLDVITIVASPAALNPTLDCFAVQACFAGCVPYDGTFPETVEDKSHALR